MSLVLPEIAPPPAGERATAPPRRVVFIDKDGTLVENVPYNVDPGLLRFVPGAAEGLRALAAAGWTLLLATNQSGIARGHFTRAQFARLQQALERKLRIEAGVHLLDVLVCPHAPGPNGSPMCLCRKPAPGMLLRAARKYRIDLAGSWMVGDTLDDVEAGRRAGCRSILFDNGGETVWRRTPLRRPDAKVSDWASVVETILAADRAAAAAGPATTAFGSSPPGTPRG